MTALVAVALKGLVVLLAAALSTRLLHGASASTRHAVWAAAFAALVVLPVLEMAGPRWSVGVLPPAEAVSFGPAVAPALPPPTPPPAPAAAAGVWERAVRVRRRGGRFRESDGGVRT